LSNLREAYAGTGRASLEWNPDAERSIDRVAAAGKANRLGLDIWKCRYGLEAQALRDAISGLAVVYMIRYPRSEIDIAERVCNQVMSEYLAQFCTTCMGKREVIFGELRTACTSCAGSGIGRYSNEARARMMQISYGKVKMLSSRMQWLYNHVSTQDKNVNAAMSCELERE